MLHRETADDDFRSGLSAPLEEVGLIQAVQAFLDFYAGERAEDAAPIAEDGDMLLIEWGEFDWGEGREFSLDLTRQVIYPDLDGAREVCQLRLVFSFAAPPPGLETGRGQVWITSPEDLQRQRQELLSRDPFPACRAQQPASVTLEWELQ